MDQGFLLERLFSRSWCGAVGVPSWVQSLQRWLGFGPPAHSTKTYLIPENLCQEGVTITTIPAHIRPKCANLEPSKDSVYGNNGAWNVQGHSSLWWKSLWSHAWAHMLQDMVCLINQPPPPTPPTPPTPYREISKAPVPSSQPACGWLAAAALTADTCLK